MNIEAPPRALNQPPISHVGKTGFYFYAPGRPATVQSPFRVPCGTTFRAPADKGQRLPYQIIPAILRAFRSKYAPHVGKKQIAKAAAKQETEAAYVEFDRWSTPSTQNP